MRGNLGIIACLLVVNASLPAIAQATQPSVTESSASVSSVSEKATGYPTPPSIAMKEGRDCDGQASQAGAITVLLRKLTSRSGATAGVQCPIPPIPEHQQPQERHE